MWHVVGSMPNWHLQAARFVLKYNDNVKCCHDVGIANVSGVLALGTVSYYR